jgi:hypothetical protein
MDRSFVSEPVRVGLGGSSVRPRKGSGWIAVSCVSTAYQQKAAGFRGRFVRLSTKEAFPVLRFPIACGGPIHIKETLRCLNNSSDRESNELESRRTAVVSSVPIKRPYPRSSSRRELGWRSCEHTAVVCLHSGPPRGETFMSKSFRTSFNRNGSILHHGLANLSAILLASLLPFTAPSPAETWTAGDR